MPTTTSFPPLFPPRLWPRHYQYGLIAAVLAGVGTLSLWTINSQQRSLQARRIQVSQAQAELAQTRPITLANPNTTSSLNAHLPALPPSNAINPVVNDMTRLAKQHHVQIVNLTVELTPKTPHNLVQHQITMQAKADYTQTKAWIGELLSRHPWLAIKSFTGQSTDTGLDIRMTWGLYVDE